MHATIAGSNGGTAAGRDGRVKKKGVPNSNYVVPLDKSLASAYTCITRPLSEILRDLNKRIPDNIINPPNSSSTLIPWYVCVYREVSFLFFDLILIHMMTK